jgi:hypothetical protein
MCPSHLGALVLVRELRPAHTIHAGPLWMTGPPLLRHPTPVVVSFRFGARVRARRTRSHWLRAHRVGGATCVARRRGVRPGASIGRFRAVVSDQHQAHAALLSFFRARTQIGRDAPSSPQIARCAVLRAQGA